MIEGTRAVLVPPRPNLGPEPWPGMRDPDRVALVIGIGAAVASSLLVLAFLLRRRRLRRVTSNPGDSWPPDAEDSPRDRLLRLVIELRRALRESFGPSMMARTTEELAGDADIRAALGDDQFAALVGLLARADRWKFDPLSEADGARSLEEDIQACQSLALALGSGRPPRK